MRDLTTALGPGSVLAGKYRLELLLGEGGMGYVWSAYNLELELPVAIKLLRAGPKNERLAERLRLEARAAARLVHPSIVRVFDIGVADSGDPFIVMELLTGESLADVLCRGRLSATRAVQLMLPIAEALALAHAKGIVHRDLKPDNVFLCTEGELLQPKLLDFGIAKLEHASAELSKLTEKGTVLGSPSYMSPEQVQGDEVDYRSDIWSFCVVLYKAISGAAPFRGADKLATMDAIMNDQPLALPLKGGVDQQLARLVHWGLTKQPSHRPGSIRELGRQLAQWLLNHGVSDDASGAPLAAKWLCQVAEPSMRRPPPLNESLEPALSREASTLTSQPHIDLHGERAEVHPTPNVDRNRSTERLERPLSPVRAHVLERIFPRRHRHWALLTAASMLIVGSSVAWTDATRDSQAHSAVTTLVAEPPTPAPVAAPREVVVAPAAAPLRAVERSAQPVAKAESAKDGTAETAAAPVSKASTPPQPRATRPKSAPARARTPAPQLPF